jgi:hypothetical protein
VVWVVTAIDSAMHLDHRNVAAWQATIVRNNAYLRENFVLSNGRADLDFIGEGFIPVSPALEARAAKSAAEGADVTARRHSAESRMDTLRQAIDDLISRGTGTRHIAAVAAEARTLVAPRQRVLAERLQAERLPIDELKGLLTSQQERLTLLPTRRRTTGQDLVQRTAALIGVATPIAAGGTWLYGAAAAGTLFPPAGLIAGAAGVVYAGVQYRKSRTTSLEVTQEEWIGAIDAEVTAIKDQFELAIGIQGMDVIDHLEDNLVQYRE